MHDLVLVLHSWVRWAVIVLGVLATAAAITSRPGDGGSRTGMFFTIALDVQFLLGLILLLTTNAFGNMGETMRDSTARFYAVEHPTIMIVAIALAHMGRVLARKAKTPAAARTRTIVFFALSVILLLFGGKKLPEFARSLGKAKNEFQKGVDEGMPASGDGAHAVPPAPVPPPSVTPQAESTPDVEQSRQPEPPA